MQKFPQIRFPPATPKELKLPCSISLEITGTIERAPQMQASNSGFPVRILPQDMIDLNSWDWKVRENAARRIFLRTIVAPRALEDIVRAFKPDTFEKYKHPKVPENVTPKEKKISMIYNVLLEYEFISQPFFSSLLAYLSPDLRDEQKMSDLFGPDLQPNEVLVKNLFLAADKAKYGPRGGHKRQERINTAWDRLKKFFDNKGLPIGTLKQETIDRWNIAFSMDAGGIHANPSEFPLSYQVPFRTRSPFFYYHCMLAPRSALELRASAQKRDVFIAAFNGDSSWQFDTDGKTTGFAYSTMLK
ncbi:Uncharacterised protein [Candidatus Gugararchaeum adminiculabundum]|nr:Uncharacterised protein [Candidatus Gugararchaeum adminiculabundum]